MSRLTYTLTQLGYLRYREEFGKYELAAGVIGLAYAYLANMTLPTIARPLMEEFARESSTNVGLGVHEGLSVLYLEYAPGVDNPNRRQSVGIRVPLVRTSMGRACIAAMERCERDKLYRELSQHYKREWPALHDELEGAVAQVENRGYCIASETWSRTTNSVAVPLLHHDGRTLLALNSQGSSQTLATALLERNGKRLVEMSAEVRRQLAAAPSTPSLGRR